MTYSTPHLKLLVDRKALTNGLNGGFLQAYMISVTCIPNRPLFFTVLTEDGALYSRLTIDNFYNENILYRPIIKNNTIKKFSKLSDLCPWSALSSKAAVISYDNMKDYACLCKIGSDKVSGFYLFTIDYDDYGLAGDPEQYKSHNLIELQNGQYAALPNNYILFKDNHFVNESAKSGIFPKYSRQKKYIRSN